jgi:hypothetical protein
MPRAIGTHAINKVYLTVNDRRQSIAEWCRELPRLKQTTVADRKRKGWTDRQCLGFDPPPPKPMDFSSFEYNGEWHTLRQWEEITKVNALTIKYRMKFGWTKGQALGFEPPPESDDPTGS